MKTYNKTFLPDEIIYNGLSYTIDTALTHALKDNTSERIIKLGAKETGKSVIMVNVLSNNLKGKTDLHGKPYKPSKWIFSTKK